MASLLTVKSQNHRMAELEMDLWRPSGPIPLLKKDHLDLVVYVHMSRWLLNITKKGNSTHSKGVLVLSEIELIF